MLIFCHQIVQQEVFEKLAIRCERRSTKCLPLVTRSTQSLFFDICCVTLCHESIEKWAFLKMESDGVMLKNTCFSQLSCQHEKNNFTSEAILLTKINFFQYFQYFQKILCNRMWFTGIFICLQITNKK